jgi:nucleoside-diphosphate-sugar epimerase
MTSKTPILVAGATGMLGFEIAKALSRREGVEVRGLVRPESLNNPHKIDKLNALKTHGVKIIEGDLLKPDSLRSACQNVEIVVSAVSGEGNVVVDGQTNLMQAAEAAGAHRFIPSDYCPDYRHLDWGDNEQLDYRKVVFNALQGNRNLNYTLVLNGIFMETLFSPYSLSFDFQRGHFKYWGNGETAFDITSYFDVAAYTAAAALDEGLVNQALEIAGDRLTMKQLCRLYQDNTIQILAEKNMGSLADLQAWIRNRKQTAKSPTDYSSQEMHYVLVSGKGLLSHNLNDRYANIRPISLRDYVRAHYRTEAIW